MKVFVLILFLGCISAYSQDPGMWAAQQASQQAMDSMNAAQQANLQMMQSAAQANAQAMQDMQQANQQFMQSMLLSTQQTPSAASIHGITREPLFSVKSGVVAPGTKLRIRCFTRLVFIYYTTDGSTPTTKSPRYRGPIRITSSMQMKAIAIGPGMAPSLIADASYTVPPPAKSTGPA